VPDNTETNMVDTDKTNILTQDLKTTGDLLDEAQTNFQNFLVMFENKLTTEIQTNQEAISLKEQTIESLQTTWKALEEQESISYSYMP